MLPVTVYVVPGSGPEAGRSAMKKVSSLVSSNCLVIIAERRSLYDERGARRVHRTGEDVSGLVGMWGAFCCRLSVFVCQPTPVDSCKSNDEDGRVFCSSAFKDSRKNVAGYDAAIISNRRGGRFSLHLRVQNASWSEKSLHSGRECWVVSDSKWLV